MMYTDRSFGDLGVGRLTACVQTIPCSLRPKTVPNVKDRRLFVHAEVADRVTVCLRRMAEARPRSADVCHGFLAQVSFGLCTVIHLALSRHQASSLEQQPTVTLLYHESLLDTFARVAVRRACS